MAKKILLTSFQTWLPHQVSNSSDDLLSQIQNNCNNKLNLHFLRNLPVNTNKASQIVINKYQEVKADVIICLGMAESRQFLTIESNACGENKQLFTNINITKLTEQLSFTKISDDAGKFVCEGLYYQILNYLKSNHFPCKALFIHVPIFTKKNQPLIIADFYRIINALSTEF